jgi:hypothetical protein
VAFVCALGAIVFAAVWRLAGKPGQNHKADAKDSMEGRRRFSAPFCPGSISQLISVVPAVLLSLPRRGEWWFWPSRRYCLRMSAPIFSGLVFR